MQKTTKGAIDAAFIRELADVLNDTNLTEIEVEHENLKIRVARNIPVQAVTYAAAAPMMQQAAPQAPVPQVASQTASPIVDLKNNPNALTSPMVGSAFRRPSPEAKAFVEIGSAVKEGDKVLLIEAMKTFNEINAHKSGTVTQILVEDKQPIEFGQPLMVIE